MQTRQLGPFEVSAIGLGAMPMSMNNDKVYPEESQAVATIHAALDAGITLIDTADIYAPSWDTMGHNETIVRKALDEPLRWISQNAGHDGYVVVSKVRELEAGHGLNAATGEYTDLVKAGVVDPVKVTRSALQNAASIAALFLTTEVVIADKPEPAPAMPAGADGGMGGMDF